MHLIPNHSGAGIDKIPLSVVLKWLTFALYALPDGEVHRDRRWGTGRRRPWCMVKFNIARNGQKHTAHPHRLLNWPRFSGKWHGFITITKSPIGTWRG